MSEAELIFTALAELSTRQIAESVEATGMNENESAAKTGGAIAKNARLELEGKTARGWFRRRAICLRARKNWLKNCRGRDESRPYKTPDMASPKYPATVFDVAAALKDR